MIITNGTVVTLDRDNRVINGGAVAFRGDAIVGLGTTPEMMSKFPGEKVLDAKGKIVMPGNVCAHTHFYGAYARGMYIPGEPASNFSEILQKLWWRLDRALDEKGVRYSALVCLLDAIRHGTTTLVDHHASPEFIDGSLDVIAEAVRESGLRASLCYEVTDRNGEAGARAGIAENARFIKKAAAEADEKLGASFGLHASFTVSDETLALCRQAIEGLDAGFHLHVAEGTADQDDSLKKYGLRVVERLEKQGILGERSIAVHCVHIDDFEKDILRETKTKVTHQPRSNMNNAVGIPDVPGLLRRKVCVGLGNDGFSNDMFLEMKTAFLVHKLNRKDPRVMGGDAVFQMAFANNKEIARLFFKKPVGELSVGAYADIILLDYFPYTPLSADNFPWQVIFGVDGSYVTHTICGGQVLMENRRIVTLDEEAISAEANDLAPAIWRRFLELTEKGL